MNHCWSKISALNTILKLSAVPLTLAVKYYYHNIYYNVEGERKYSIITAKIKCGLPYRNHGFFFNCVILAF